MRGARPVRQLRLTVPEQETPVSNFLTASGTFQDGDLMLNRSGLRLISDETGSSSQVVQPQQQQDDQESEAQFLLEDLETVKVIGKGSGGVVQLVRNKWTGTLFALKGIQMNVQETVRKHIVQELKINQAAQCPHIVVCYHSYYHNGVISLVLEYMDCGSLADVLKQVQIILEPYLAVVCKQVLKGLVYLHHERHVIHRDIKPSNLLVNHKGEVKITDFGVSAVLASSMAQRDTFVGTYYYMSDPFRIRKMRQKLRCPDASTSMGALASVLKSMPERINANSYDYKSDIWSFGLVILECAIGRFPYIPSDQEEGWINFYELLETIVEQPPPSAPADQFSPEFCSFISACVQKNPQDRMSSLELLEHPFIKKFEDKDVDLKVLLESIDAPANVEI